MGGGHGHGASHASGASHHGRQGGYGFYPGYGGYGLGYWPYGWGYGGYGYGSYGYSSAGSAGATVIYADPDDPYGYGYRYLQRGYSSAYTAPPATNVAYVRLVVPEDAEVWFNGVKSGLTGRVREFESPVLQPGKTYRYELEARWREDGKLVERSRTLRVQPNAWTVLDLTRP